MHRGTEERTIWLMCLADIRSLEDWPFGLAFSADAAGPAVHSSIFLFIYISIHIWDEAWGWSVGMGYIGGAYP